MYDECEMDIGKPKRIVISAATEGEDMHQVTTEKGAPRVPKIGGKPDKKTQNIPLMEILSQINFRRKPKEAPPEDNTQS